MNILQNISLKHYNTFGVDVNAKYFAEYNSEDELRELLLSDIVKCNRYLHIGGGSNLLFLNDFDGIIMHSAIKSIEIASEDNDYVYVRVGAGTLWDDFVEYCVTHHWYGVENLSLIPGEVGASAVQNIGAYGMEVKDTIEAVEAIEIETLTRKTFTNQDCQYDYRNSIFKTKFKNQYVITFVTFKLKKAPTFKLEYQHLNASVLQRGEVNLRNVRNTIISIREEKLPNPSVMGNAGSFFMNPIIATKKWNELSVNYPSMPHYNISQTEEKIPAGWLIEQCGFKGKQFENVGVHENQALVIVNLGNASGKEIVALAELIQSTVKQRFDIDILPEVNYIR